MSLHAGTSGWAFKQWKPDFYPAKLPQSKFLEFYATRMTACEINNTFYRVPQESTFVKWATATPESFRYAVKAHRMLTHRKDMVPSTETRGFIDDFVKLCSTLGPRLGVILFQFAPFTDRNDGGLDAYLRALPPGADYAFEFRNEAWDTPDVKERVAAANATVCVSDTTGRAPDTLPPGPIAYVRLRRERYTDDERAAWLELLRKEAETRHVFVFCKHETGPADDPHRGVSLARWLVDNA